MKLNRTFVINIFSFPLLSFLFLFSISLFSYFWARVNAYEVEINIHGGFYRMDLYSKVPQFSSKRTNFLILNKLRFSCSFRSIKFFSIFLLIVSSPNYPLRINSIFSFFEFRIAFTVSKLF